MNKVSIGLALAVPEERSVSLRCADSYVRDMHSLTFQ
jgi:hypothetical protein